MRRISRLLLLVFACLIVMFAVANPDPVAVRLLPEGAPFPPLAAIEMPVFLLALAGLFVGIAVGVIGEWFRDRSVRRGSGR